MRAIKKARRLIESQPHERSADVLSRLVIALETEQPFALNDLYGIGYDEFRLALEVIEEWRLDRYYASKARLLGTSVMLTDVIAQTSAGQPLAN